MSTPQTEAPAVTATNEAPETHKPSAVDALFAESKAKPSAISAEAAPSGESPSSPKAPAADSHAKQLALIAREQKKLAAEQATAKKRDAEIQSWREKAEKYDAEGEQWKKDPVGVLKARNLDYNRLVEIELQRQSEEADPSLRRVRELEEKLSAKDKREAELEAQNAEAAKNAAVKEFVGNVATHLSQNAEKYEFLNAYKGAQDVFDHIKAEFDKSCVWDDGTTGPRPEGAPKANLVDFKEMSIDEACQVLEAQYDESSTPLASLKKMQAKIAKQIEAATKSAPSSTKAPLSVPKSSSSTLTNSAASGGSEKAPRQLTKEERAERAWRAVHGELS